MHKKAYLQQLRHYHTNQSHLYKHFPLICSFYNLCYCLVYIIEKHACTNIHTKIHTKIQRNTAAGLLSAIFYIYLFFFKLLALLENMSNIVFHLYMLTIVSGLLECVPFNGSMLVTLKSATPAHWVFIFHLPPHRYVLAHFTHKYQVVYFHLLFSFSYLIFWRLMFMVISN